MCAPNVYTGWRTLAGFFVAIVMAPVFEAALEAKTAIVGGVIFTPGSEKTQTVWPAAGRSRIVHKGFEVRGSSRVPMCSPSELLGEQDHFFHSDGDGTSTADVNR